MAGAVADHRDQVLTEGSADEVVIVSHQLPIWVTRLASEGRSLGLNAGRRVCTLASVTSLHFNNGVFVGLDYNEPAEELLAGAVNIPGA
jgi:broad specificity phosphatase PhoE